MLYVDEDIHISTVHHCKHVFLCQRECECPNPFGGVQSRPVLCPHDSVLEHFILFNQLVKHIIMTTTR